MPVDRCSHMILVATALQFHSITKKVSSTNNDLGHLSLNVTSKNLVRKKIYLITLTDLESETLAILGISIIVKFNGITPQVELDET